MLDLNQYPGNFGFMHQRLSSSVLPKTRALIVTIHLAEETREDKVFAEVGAALLNAVWRCYPLFTESC